MKSINKRVYGYATSVIALGNEMKCYMIKQGFISEEEKIKVIPNWYSTNKITDNATVFNKEFKELRKSGHSLYYIVVIWGPRRIWIQSWNVYLC